MRRGIAGYSRGCRGVRKRTNPAELHPDFCRQEQTKPRTASSSTALSLKPRVIFPCLHPPDRAELGGRQSLAPILAAEHRTGRQLESERRNCREEAKGSRAPSSKAHPLTYFHSPSRGSRIRNNQNPAGNNIQLPNWVVCAADVSSVSPGGSLFYCFFFKY